MSSINFFVASSKVWHQTKYGHLDYYNPAHREDILDEDFDFIRLDQIIEFAKNNKFVWRFMSGLDIKTYCNDALPYVARLEEANININKNYYNLLWLAGVFVEVLATYPTVECHLVYRFYNEQRALHIFDKMDKAFEVVKNKDGTLSNKYPSDKNTDYVLEYYSDNYDGKKFFEYIPELREHSLPHYQRWYNAVISGELENNEIHETVDKIFL